MTHSMSGQFPRSHNKRHLSKAITAALASALLMAMSNVALAQDEDDEASAGTLEEVLVTARKRSESIYEVPISYNGREWDEGKKIKWHDAPKAAWTLLRFRFTE